MLRISRQNVRRRRCSHCSAEMSTTTVESKSNFFRASFAPEILDPQFGADNTRGLAGGITHHSGEHRRRPWTQPRIGALHGLVREGTA